MKTTVTVRPNIPPVTTGNHLRHLCQSLLFCALLGWGFAASAQTQILCGQAIAGSIPAPTGIDQYTYNGSAGEQLVFSFVGYGNCYSFGNNAVLDLYNPAGQKIVTLEHCGVRSTNLTLAASGAYTIVVHDGGYASTTTSYGLSIQSFTGGGCNGTPIVCGQTISNAISLPTKSDSYTYAGNAGETLVFSFVGYGNCYSFGNNAVLDLYNPAGQKIVTLTHCGVRSTNLTLAASGTYTILVHDGAYASTTTSYGLSIQSFTGGGCNGTPIACGQTISNAISLPTKSDSYTYAGNAGETLVFSFVGYGNCYSFGNNAVLDLYNPAGQKIVTLTHCGVRSTNLTLATSGTYTILIHDGAYASPTTSYGVSIQSFTGGGYNQTPIVCGQAISNAISLPTKSDSYSYAGNAGQTLVFSFVGYGNCYSFGNNAVLDLYNPVGQKIATLDHCGVRSTNLTLATSGNYTILVHDSVYASPTASYAVSVQSFTGGGCNGTPIVCGQTISNNLSLPAQARSHGFATGGGLVIFSFGGFAGVQFDLYAPTGNKLFTRTPGTATNITLAAGAYTLLVHDGNYANIGAYSFSATCIGTPCNYTISPGGILVGPGATNGTVAVAASSGCAWSALASASWLMITGVSGASGNGTVSYAVEANTSPNSRVGILTVQGLNFTVNQAGVQVFAGQDIGDTSVPGSSTYSNGVYTLRGSGEDIEGTADAFHFAHLPLAGDGQIIARIVSLQAPQAAAEVGVMFRETLDSGSKHAFLRLNMGTNAMFRRRLATDIGSRGNPHTGTNISWLRLMRMGDTFVGFTSSNGLDWNYVWFSTVNMSNQVRVGLAITAHHNGQLAEARVDNVAIGKLTPLSGNWPETSTRIHLGGEPMGWDGMQPIGGFKMLVRGAIGEQLRLRFSSDATTPVASWSVLGTVTNKLGAVIVLDSQAPVNPLKFYAAEKMAP